VLPAATFAESDGTFVSSEGRTRDFSQAFIPQNDISPSWRWLAPDHWQQAGRCACANVGSVPGLAAASYAAPPAAFRIAGAKIPVHRIAKAAACNARKH